MILLSIIVAALGLISLVCLLIVVWPPPRQERPERDELRAQRRLRPEPSGTVDRVDEAS